MDLVSNIFFIRGLGCGLFVDEFGWASRLFTRSRFELGCFGIEADLLRIIE